MPTDLHRNDVRRMVADGVNLVEVLSSTEYGGEHIQGAINIPLRQINREITSHLQRDQPIITYCHDYQ